MSEELYNILRSKVNKTEGIIDIDESGANKEEELTLFCRGISMPDSIRDLIYEKRIDLIDYRMEDKDLMKLWVSLHKSDIAKIEKVIAKIIAVSWYVPETKGSVGIKLKVFTNRNKAEKFLQENGFPESALSEFELTWDIKEYNLQKSILTIK
ncbi:MAG: hypothetical protein ACFFDB_00085 [Promethearchaeota archaeon]